MKANKIAVQMIVNTARDMGHTVRNFSRTSEVSVKSKNGLIHTYVMRMFDENTLMIGTRRFVINTLGDLENAVKMAVKEFKPIA